MTKDTPEMTAFAHTVLSRYIGFLAGGGIGFGLLLWGVRFEHAVLMGLIVARIVENQMLFSVASDYLKEKRMQSSPATESEA